MDKMGQAEQTTTRAEHALNVRPGGPCHHYGEGAPLKQIHTRACGHYCQKRLDEDRAEQQCSQRDVLGQAEQEEGLQEAREVLEHVLSEVMAFLELSGTVQQEHIEKRLQSVTVPPDRSGELEGLQNEIEKIKLEMQRLKKADKLEVKVKIRTVPPKNHHRLKMSTRKASRPEKSLGVPKIRRGVKPLGENGVIWKAKIDMKRMFTEKKLLWGAVPPPTTASPATTGNLQEKRLQGEAVPPPTTARPIENKISRKRLLWGTVPPATRATPAEKENKPTDKRLFRRAVLPSTTATPTEIVTSKHSKHESRTVPTSQTLIVKKLLKKKCQERKTRKK